MIPTVKHLCSSLNHRKYNLNIVYHRKHAQTDPINICLVNKHTETAILKRISLEGQNIIEGPDIGSITHIFASGTHSIACDGEEYLESGNAIFEKPKEYNPANHQCGMQEYAILKRNISANTLATSAFGTITTGVVLGVDKSLAFFMGSMLAIMYMEMLYYEIDHIGKPSSIFINSMTRLATISALACAIIQQQSHSMPHQDLYFMLGVLGFLSFKLSVLRS